MTSYYCAGANHRTVPDCDALQNNCTGPDPDPVPNPDGVTDNRLFSYGASRIDPMVMVRDVAEWADKAVASHLDAFRCIEHSEPIYVAAAVNDQSRGIASQTSCQQHNVIIQGNPVRDHNIPRISRYLNTPDPTFSTNPDTKQSQAGYANTIGDGAWITNETVG
jgi:hypothetical protein